MQRLLLTAIMVAFTVLGLFLLLASADAEGRAGGAALALFFGVGGSAYIGLPLLTRRSGPGTILRGRARTSGGDEPAFLFPVPRAKRILGVIAAAGLAAGSALMGLAGAVVVGVIGGVFFTGLLVAMLMTLRRPRHLGLTPTRVQVAVAAMVQDVPWEALRGAEVYEQPAARGTTITTVGISADPDAVTTTGGARWLARLNRGFTPYAMTIGAHDLAGSADVTVRVLEDYRRDPARRAAIGTPEEHARLLAELAWET